jgi:hypothetical protein
VKFLLLLMVLSLVGLMPFVVLRKPWAIGVWRRMKQVILIYVIVIAVFGVLRLVLNFDDIYG